MKSQTENLRVVVFAEGEAWIAQALELDVCAQGANPDEARERFLDTLDCELSMALDAGEDPTESIGAAPKQFFSMWDQRSAFSSIATLDRGDDGRVELALCA